MPCGLIGPHSRELVPAAQSERPMTPKAIMATPNHEAMCNALLPLIGVVNGLEAIG